VLGQHEGLGVLVMTWLAPADHRLWKEMLRRGDADLATARAVGATLGRIHAYSAARPALAVRFDTDKIFFDIRLEPYLLATARRHPESSPGARAARGDDGGDEARARPRRRESEEHRHRRRGAGLLSTPSAPGGATRRSTWRSA
jgi:hypothetical protein